MATYKPKRKTASGLEDIQIPYEMIANPPAGITDIDTQYVRIWGLDTGIYRLTYEGTKFVYYKGATSTSSISFDVDKPIIYVNGYTNSSGTEYLLWSSITINSNNYPQIASGYCTASSGQYYRKDIDMLLTGISSYVKNSLDYNTSNTSYALSAYQGYLLNQRLQAVENKEDNDTVVSITDLRNTQ